VEEQEILTEAEPVSEQAAVSETAAPDVGAAFAEPTEGFPAVEPVGVFPAAAVAVPDVQAARASKRHFVGIVTNKRKNDDGKVIGMDKTLVVAVSTRKLHRLYKKYVTSTKKYKAHDEANLANIGDRVRIVESRPISREKRWRLVEVVEQAR
jgi:small subunit ribosomal protein S17